MTDSMFRCPGCNRTQRSPLLRQYVTNRGLSECFATDPFDGQMRCIECIDTRQYNWERKKRQVEDLFDADRALRQIPSMPTLGDERETADEMIAGLQASMFNPGQLDQEQDLLGRLIGIKLELQELVKQPVIQPIRRGLVLAIRSCVTQTVINAYQLVDAYNKALAAEARKPTIKMVK